MPALRSYYAGPRGIERPSHDADARPNAGRYGARLRLARVSGRSKSEVVREAIVRLLEDAEDLELAEKALRATRSTKSLRQLRKELGLER